MNINEFMSAMDPPDKNFSVGVRTYNKLLRDLNLSFRDGHVVRIKPGIAEDGTLFLDFVVEPAHEN